MPTPLDPSAHNGALDHFAAFCPLDGSHLRVLRAFVGSVAEEAGFGEDDLEKIVMAVDEACSNVLLHAYEAADSKSGGIELRLWLDPEALTISVQDHGKGGPAEKLRGAESLEDYRQCGREDYSGLGLLVIKEFMDEVALAAEPGVGARVTMRKYRARDGE